MKPTTLLPLTLCLAAGLLLASANPAAADKPSKNLKVLKTDTNHKVLEKAMKALSKGLGVKCAACHVKGKFDSDEVKAKVVARDFFSAVVGEADAGKRDAALKALLPSLELTAVKNAEGIWAGMKTLEKAK